MKMYCQLSRFTRFAANCFSRIEIQYKKKMYKIYRHSVRSPVQRAWFVDAHSIQCRIGKIILIGGLGEFERATAKKKKNSMQNECE